jgi:hypothetical protein
VNRNKADELSKVFGLNVIQSRYSDWGNFYGLVQSYPCALWDRSGYILFSNEDALKIPGVSVGKRINVPKGISSLNGYKRVIYGVQLPEELPDGVKYQEGAVHHYGDVCQVCSVMLRDVYGAIAETLIHVHHLKPISEIGKSYMINPVADLIPVCPNCHAVIHLKTPPYSPQQVSAMLNNDQTV